MSDASHDTKLLARLRSGDEAALAEFVEANRAALLGFLHARIGSHLAKKTEAEDILQDASLEAVRSLDKAPLDTWDPLHWLFQICERKIIDAHRRHFASQKRDASREAALPDGSEAGGGLANLLAASMTTPSAAFRATSGNCACWPHWTRFRKNSAKPSACVTSSGCRRRKSPRSWARVTAPSASCSRDHLPSCRKCWQKNSK
jgi:DNA-directed RNA polymerase specialized sigma24 family protein